MSENYEGKIGIDVNLKYVALIYIGIIWTTLFPAVVVGYLYFSILPFSFTLVNILLLIPLFFLLYGITLVSSVIVTKIGIWITYKRIAYPKEGTYPLSMDHPQTRAYFTRHNVRGFGKWLYYFFNRQFLIKFWLRRCGIKIGKNVKICKYLLMEELINIGDNTFLSKYCIIAGHLMDQTSLTLNETVIGKNVIMEHITGSVGGEVGDNSIFRTVTGAMKGQICRGNAIYQGVPCHKIGENDLSPEEIESLKESIITIDKTDFIKRKNELIKISNIKLALMKTVIIIVGIAIGLVFPFLYSLLYSAFASPTNHLLNILLLIPLPFLFLVGIGFFVVGTTLAVKIFLVYYSRKAEIPEGTYELDDPLAKIFKVKYLLRMFGLKVFHKSPFKVADSLALRVWGDVKIGRVLFEDAIVDPQYIEIGENVIMGGGARIHTHDIVKGKLYIKKVKIGNNVIIGSFCQIRPGVEIADGSVIAVAAWLRKNRKCKRRALWVGKPAFELPIEMITQAAGAKKKVVDDKYDKKHKQDKA